MLAPCELKRLGAGIVGMLSCVLIVHYPQSRCQSAPSHKTHEIQSHNMKPEFLDFKTLAFNYYTLFLVLLCPCEYAKESQIPGNKLRVGGEEEGKRDRAAA